MTTLGEHDWVWGGAPPQHQCHAQGHVTAEGRPHNTHNMKSLSAVVGNYVWGLSTENSPNKGSGFQRVRDRADSH